MPACAGTWEGVGSWQRADTFTCRHIYVLTYESYLGAGMCWHVSAPGKCRQLRRCRHLPTHIGADTCRHLWYRSYGLWCAGMCRTCRHVSAPSQVSAPFQVLTYASTSQLPNKKSPYDLYHECRHMLASIRVCTCLHLPRCRHPFMWWYMWWYIPAHPSFHIKKSIWLVSQVSARVGMCSHLQVSQM